MDCDNTPMSIELDNYSARRIARIEYKWEGEKPGYGAALHFRAELESVRPNWEKKLFLVIDDGQKQVADSVVWGVRSSQTPRDLKGWEKTFTSTVGELRDGIVGWLWPEAKEAR